MPFMCPCFTIASRQRAGAMGRYQVPTNGGTAGNFVLRARPDTGRIALTGGPSAPANTHAEHTKTKQPQRTRFGHLILVAVAVLADGERIGQRHQPGTVDLVAGRRRGLGRSLIVLRVLLGRGRLRGCCQHSPPRSGRRTRRGSGWSLVKCRQRDIESNLIVKSQ